MHQWGWGGHGRTKTYAHAFGDLTEKPSNPKHLIQPAVEIELHPLCEKGQAYENCTVNFIRYLHPPREGVQQSVFIV